jgi:hypothetical protein
LIIQLGSIEQSVLRGFQGLAGSIENDYFNETSPPERVTLRPRTQPDSGLPDLAHPPPSVFDIRSIFRGISSPDPNQRRSSLQPDPSES